MKLVYLKSCEHNSRHRKIKAVAKATGLTLVEQIYSASGPVPQCAGLPQLETEEGFLSSPNSIIRYLASVNGYTLYGGDSLHERALIDQYLDVTTCEFQRAVLALTFWKSGHQLDLGNLHEDIIKYFNYLEKELLGKEYLVGNKLSIADIALATNVSVPLTLYWSQKEREVFPNIIGWYRRLAGVNSFIGPSQLPKEEAKGFKNKQKLKQEKTAIKSERVQKAELIQNIAILQSEKKLEKQEKRDDPSQ